VCVQKNSVTSRRLKYVSREEFVNQIHSLVTWLSFFLIQTTPITASNLNTHIYWYITQRITHMHNA